MRRRDFLRVAGAGAASLAVPRRAFAQAGRQRLVASMIGAASPNDPAGIAYVEAVREGFRQEGWIDGENIRFEFRFTAGEPGLSDRYAAELLALAPDIFVTGVTENAVAVRNVTRTIPLVFAAVSDPIGAGLIDRIATPGGNTTGISHFEPSQAGKFVDVLMEVAPTTTLVVSLTNPATAIVPALMRPFIIEACAVYGVGFAEAMVNSLEEIGPAVDAIAAMPGRVGLVLPGNNWVHNNAVHFVEPINRRAIPAVYPATRMVEQGGLVGFGVATTDSFRMAGIYAGRILNGVDPATLPVLSARVELFVNLRTAEAQGITIPISILATADRIIE